MTQETLSCSTDEVAIPVDAETSKDFEESASEIEVPAIATEEEGDPQSHEPSEAYLTTVFNHEARQFGRDEAEQLVQIGLYSKPHIDRLKYLAKLTGEAGVKELLNRLIDEGEKKLTDDISEKVFDPQLAKQIADERIANLRGALSDDEQNQSATEAKDDINRRLAEEFLELQREFPQTEDFGALPQWVKEKSAIDGVPLVYAYAMHLCQEQKKISAAEEMKSQREKSVIHSLKSQASDGTGPEMASVYKALWGQY